jgi:hypothetical protein
VSVTSGAVITGTHPALDGKGGQLFIPFSRPASGELGAGGVGLSTDAVQLLDDDRKVGWVTLTLTFDLDSVPGEPVFLDPAGPLNLSLTLDDIDFLPDFGFRRRLPLRFTESLRLAYLRDATDKPTGTPLRIDEHNYLTFRTDGGTGTNNVTAKYNLDLVADLGVTAADIADANADREFGLRLRFRAVNRTTDRWPSHPNSLWVTNTPEAIAAYVEATEVPEPGTSALLLAGGCLLFASRRAAARRGA